MSEKEIVLTGITTTGTPHLGNYVGAIRPAIELSKRHDVQPFYFLADYHALIKCQDPQKIQQSTLEIAATWLALGLDTENAVFYRQSDIPEVTELCWILSCVTPKGLMNRAHAYKAAVAENMEKRVKDLDRGITMGLYCYPILMAADILLFRAKKIPVGKDQIQHIEMARDIAGRFNHIYKKQLLVLPEPMIREEAAVLPGLDGRKMSKSYNNTIPIFASEKKLRKLIFKIKTNSLPPEAPKDPETCTLFAIFKAFAMPEEVEALRKRYEQGIAWSEVKQFLFEYLNNHFKEARQRYEELLQHPEEIERILQQGAEHAREVARPFMREIRYTIGIRSLTEFKA